MAERKAKPKVQGSARGAVSRKPVRVQKAAAATQRASGQDASRLIDVRIRSLADWRGQALAEARRLIHEAAPDVIEEWKWMGTPVWSQAGNICTGETYKQVVKLTFAHGASLADPRKLFNSSLEGNTRRAIDLREGEKLNAKAFKGLIKAAIAENVRRNGLKTKKTELSEKPSAKAKSGAKSMSAEKKTAPNKTKLAKLQKNENGVVLLSGGNPQIAKADGDAPVQAYIAAMPGWKSGLGKRLDELIVRNAPKVRKAVRWNSPFYGIEGQGWFLSFHVFTRYVKVTFFNGGALKPIPPGGTEKSKEARWIDIHEHDEFDEAQMARWVKQAAALPGWNA